MKNIFPIIGVIFCVIVSFFASLEIENRNKNRSAEVFKEQAVEALDNPGIRE